MSSSTPEWDWERPDELSGQMDTLLSDLARCDELERIRVDPPLSRDQLRQLGVTGIEFAVWKTNHASGLGTDLVPLRGRVGDAVTGLGELYRVDGEFRFICLDIRDPLPFDTGSVDWVYAEHLIEHVPLGVAVAWLTEVRRILAPGGVLRLTTPDLHRYVASYLSDDRFFARHRGRLKAAGLGPPMPSRKAFMFNQIFYLYGHRWIYDLAELRHVLTRAGFPEQAVAACGFREGFRKDVAGLDRVLRNDETIYVEVIR